MQTRLMWKPEYREKSHGIVTLIIFLWFTKVQWGRLNRIHKDIKKGKRVYGNVNINEANLLTQKSNFGLKSPLVRTSATCWLEGMYEKHMLPLSILSLINLNMFSSIMLSRVVSNTNSGFIVTKKLQCMVSHTLDED